MENNEVTLRELAEAVCDYDRERDDEWRFADEHGLDDTRWSEDDMEEHQMILDNITEKRNRVNELLKRIDPKLGLQL